MSITACMGGWCTRRDYCPHFQAAVRDEPAERLCPPGRDGEMLTASSPSPVRMVQVRHKAKLALDPRFAGWVAGAKA